MDDAKTRKTWGVYDETGIFMAVCRHGSCLLIVDMVQSGELYVSTLFDGYWDAIGFDIQGQNIHWQ